MIWQELVGNKGHTAGDTAGGDGLLENARELQKFEILWERVIQCLDTYQKEGKKLLSKTINNNFLTLEWVLSLKYSIPKKVSSLFSNPWGDTSWQGHG